MSAEKIGSRSATPHSISISHDSHTSQYAPVNLNTDVVIPRVTDLGVERLLEEVLSSDIGLDPLQARLKESITSTKDFANFLKKRAFLEEEHASGLRKICRGIFDAANRSDTTTGSSPPPYYSYQLQATNAVHVQIAENGYQFSRKLLQVHEELTELALSIERSRRDLKMASMTSEKKLQVSEAAVRSARARYGKLVEDKTKARDSVGKTGFSLKTPSLGALASSLGGGSGEAEIEKKIQLADNDYNKAVRNANDIQQELIQSKRPEMARALKQMIFRIDSALVYHMHKFSELNEKLLVNNSYNVSRIKVEKNDSVPDARHSSEFGAMLNGKMSLETYQQSVLERAVAIWGRQSRQSTPQPAVRSSYEAAALIRQLSLQDENGSSGRKTSKSKKRKDKGNEGRTPSRLSPLPPPPAASPVVHKPVFGIPLAKLSEKDRSAVPIIVLQCIQAVDLFGMDVEGIYRLSGTNTHVQKIKELFNTDSDSVDFRQQESFLWDINSVSSVIKQFFRELPEPLLTDALYSEFITAAKIDDYDSRIQALQVAVNKLPDPNYATLRALMLHLYRIQDNSEVNRMPPQNLAIPFGPTLMDDRVSPRLADAAWQVRCIETILKGCYEIFEADD